jgi:hypothetical protein
MGFVVPVPRYRSTRPGCDPDGISGTAVPQGGATTRSARPVHEGSGSATFYVRLLQDGR